MKLYFERHDGQAVTCDDFAQAIADANPQSSLAMLLPQFKRWYSQAGTPRVQATGNYNISNNNQSPPTTNNNCTQTVETYFTALSFTVLLCPARCQGAVPRHPGIKQGKPRIPQ
jgi:aminopeptidase N